MERCNCPMCNNFYNKVNKPIREPLAHEYPPEKKELPKSLHERLAQVSDKLEAEGASPIYINELNDLCDQINDIDDELIKLQKGFFRKPLETTQIQLGELSKRIY